MKQIQLPYDIFNCKQMYNMQNKIIKKANLSPEKIQLQKKILKKQ